MKIAKLSLLVLMQVTISQPSYSQPTNSTTVGRYVIVGSTAGQNGDTQILDSQTGRIWIQRGRLTQEPFLVPCYYQLLDGRSSLVPIDEETERLCLNIARNSPTNSPEGGQTPPKDLEKLQRELYSADAEAQFWTTQLARITSGKPWTSLEGWDKVGRAVLGSTHDPSDASVKVVEGNLEACLKAKTATQEKIRNLTGKAP